MLSPVFQPAPQVATAAYHVQRSLRHCLSTVAELLYDNGHVLETITLPQRGLTQRELTQLSSQEHWKACQQVLEESGAAQFNDYDRLVLTTMGREIMFDMFGQGAADCA
ncbi:MULTISPECIES: hypothetical protein [unclassified Halomonas]|uniref:hypothetical protein n=1 Tax=unclassified Halomonas TaxID=2609666 RepID=UPI0009904E46|nr:MULTISPECIES: hypothetical protein [unclassified Halomonas]AQU84849.1 hypothetical protein B2G49_21010 [Halomonas sp. 'Soap Lake \